MLNTDSKSHKLDLKSLCNEFPDIPCSVVEMVFIFFDCDSDKASQYLIQQPNLFDESNLDYPDNYSIEYTSDKSKNEKSSKEMNKFIKYKKFRFMTISGADNLSCDNSKANLYFTSTTKESPSVFGNSFDSLNTSILPLDLFVTYPFSKSEFEKLPFSLNDGSEQNELNQNCVNEKDKETTENNNNPQNENGSDNSYLITQDTKQHFELDETNSKINFEKQNNKTDEQTNKLICEVTQLPSVMEFYSSGENERTEMGLLSKNNNKSEDELDVILEENYSSLNDNNDINVMNGIKVEIECTVNGYSVEISINIPTSINYKTAWVGLYDRYETNNKNYIKKVLIEGKYSVRLFINENNETTYKHCNTSDFVIGQVVFMTSVIKFHSSKRFIEVRVNEEHIGGWVGIYGHYPIVSNSNYTISSGITTTYPIILDITNLKPGVYECRYFSKDSSEGLLNVKYHCSGSKLFRLY
ncbi:Uncharacterized protein QTN25_000354 [Entamoeba marina]